MNSQRIARSLGWTLSTVGLALLAACGGGGGDSPAPAVVQVATPAVASTVCGITPTAQTGAEAFSIQATQTMQINGFDTQITLLTSPTGYSYAGVDVRLNVPLLDLRNVNQHGYPEAQMLDTMGIEMGSRFAAGAVGCVAGVTRVFDVNGTSLMSWTSQQMPELPLERLTNSAINGFEFINNFDSTQATAVFRISRSTLVDPASAAICHISAAGAVDCATPNVQASTDGQQWEIRRPITEPGVYMLTASPEPLV